MMMMSYHGNGVWLQQLRRGQDREVSNIDKHIDDSDERDWDPDSTR